MRNPRTTTKCSAYLQQLEKAPVLCVQLLSHVPLYNPMNCSPPMSSVRGIGMGCHFILQGILQTQGWNPLLLHCRQILYH